MHNFNVVNKGEYVRKQTSENVGVSRFIIVRKRQKRFLVLELENKRAEVLTSLNLQIDQFNGKGNYLDTKNVTVEKLNKAKGKFVLQVRIELHRACADFFAKVLMAEYGEYRFCLDENGNYSVFNKVVEERKVQEKEVKKAVGESGKAQKWHKFGAPRFVRVLSVLVLAIVIGFSAWQVIEFKGKQSTFTLNGITYEFVDDNRADDAPIVITGVNGFSNKVVISENVEGHPVYRINSDAFKGNQNISEIVINGNVLVDSYLFSDCYNLKKATINNVDEIPVGTFANCYNLSHVEINNTSKINTLAFKDCINLQSLTVVNKDEKSVLKIDNNVFNTFQVLDTIKIDQYLDFSEGKAVFSGLSGAINLSLKNYNHAPYENPTDSTEYGITGIFGTSFAVVENLHINNIDKVTDYFALGTSDGLKSVKIDNLVSTVLGKNAFEDCVNLQEIETQKPFTEVGDFALKNTSIKTFEARALRSIGESAFEGCVNLEEFDLSINNLLTELPERAFYGTEKLKAIHFSSELTAIGQSCFYGSGLEQIEFEEKIKVETIENSAFYGCKNLQQIVLPASVKAIGDSAFEQCELLSSIAFPTELETVGNNAFAYNVALTQISLPDTVTAIGTQAFMGCNAVEHVKVPFLGETLSSNGALGYLFGCDYYQQGNYLPNALTKVEVTLDDDVSDGAFFACHKLKEVVLPNDLNSIGEQAFAECYRLSYLTIPASVTYIGNGAFNNCYRLFEIKNLSSVNISRGDDLATYALAVYDAYDSPLSSERINGYKFIQAPEGWYLVDLPAEKNLILPEAVNFSTYSIPKYFFFNEEIDSVKLTQGARVVGDYAFSNTLIKEIVFAQAFVSFGEKPIIENNNLIKVDFGATGIIKISDEMVAYNPVLQEVVLPQTIREIGEKAFCQNYNLSKINMPSSLQTIKASAFLNCASLKNVDLTKTKVEAIDKEAFYGCSSLETAILNDGLVNIGASAFANCNSLSKIYIPNSVENIDEGILSNCSNINQLTVPFIGSTLYNDATIGYLFGYDNYYDQGYGVSAKSIEITNDNKIVPYCFMNCSRIESIILNDSITSIGEQAFACCYGLKSVKLPSSLTSLGSEAFISCEQLKSVELPTSLSTISSGTFSSCYNLEQVNFSENLYYIEDSAFANCNSLGTVSIPSSVVSVGNNAFENCNSLSAVNFGEGLISLGERAFYNCYSLGSVVLPNSLMSLGAGAFSYCSNLTSVSLNQNLSSVSSEAFKGCYSIKSIQIPSNVTTIESSAFENCSALEEVKFLVGLRYIEDYAFANCPIKSLQIPSTLTNVGDGAFSNCYNLECVILPQGLSRGIYVSSSAFEGSNSIYQIYDLAGWGITKFSTSLGGIAKNVVVIDTTLNAERLKSAEVNGLNVRYRDDVCAIVGYSGQSQVALSSIKIGEKTFNDYVITSYAFSGIWLNTIKFTNVNVTIYPYAFNTNIELVAFSGCGVNIMENAFYSTIQSIVYDRAFNKVSYSAFSEIYCVYYYGTSSEWYTYLYNKLPSVLKPDYYYSECIHEYGQGLWTYDSYGYIYTSLTQTHTRTIKEPTCEEYGTGEEYCDKCDYISEYTISPIGHYIEDYMCLNCGKVQATNVNVSTYPIISRRILTTTNDSKNPFALFDYSVDYSSMQSTNTEVNSTSTITFKANTNVTLSCRYDFSSFGIGKVVIKINGEVVSEFTGDTTTQTAVLKKGDVISISFVRNDVENENCYVRMKNVKIA